MVEIIIALIKPLTYRVPNMGLALWKTLYSSEELDIFVIASVVLEPVGTISLRPHQKYQVKCRAPESESVFQQDPQVFLGKLLSPFYRQENRGSVGIEWLIEGHGVTTSYVGL